MDKIKFISRYSKGYRRNLVIMILSTLVYVVVVLINPILVKFTIDNVINTLEITSPMGLQFVLLLGGMEFIRANLWVVALLFVGLTVFSSMSLFVRGESTGLFAESFTMNLRNELYDHLQKLPYAYHVRSKTGDLIQRCTSDVNQISRFLSNQVRELTYALFMVGVALTVMFTISVKMTLISMIAFPIIFIFAIRFFKDMQTTFKQYDEEEAELFNVFKESLDAVRVVKAFNRERYELEKFDGYNKKLKVTSKKMFKLLGIYWGTSDFICFAQILLVLISATFQVRTGALSVGDAMLFVSYISMVLWPIRNVGRILSDMGKVGVAIERLEEVFDTEMEDLETGIKPLVKGNIEFKNVSFQYDDGIEPVLNDVSFDINEGQTVAIMGPTGSGKSSLVHLLTRLYDATSGQIIVDGHDLTEIAPSYIREKVGIVLQEPYLFSKSIYDNIKLATPNSSEKDVYNAAQVASIHDVINSFDQGYGTLVGEKGVTLSGGQKQRVAIARTIINEHPIIIFDDSLSALDSETDASIRRDLKTMDHGATTIIITHRINSAMAADKIIVLNEGAVVQVGDHKSLMAQEGLYRRIAMIQNNEIGGDSDESSI